MRELELNVAPEIACDDEMLRHTVAAKTGISPANLHFRILKRSIDARKKPVVYRLRILADEQELFSPRHRPPHNNVASKPEVHIIGCGPAGLFAAVELISLGFKPILFERGKNVRDRRRDLAAINRQHVVNPESNYCFGEGGAGTYSDGKLYTRSTKRGNVLKVLELLVAFGAPAEILYDAHPHIGTNKLPQIITRIREFITSCGGEVHFNSRLTGLVVRSNKLAAIEINNSTKIPCNQLILATGHSARDIFHLLKREGILIEAKPFALGVRVEHPQEIIDRIQYHNPVRSEFLPPASYSLVQQVNGRGVYSFCMCPGGIIAPCATAPGEIVTNGWSPSKRNNPFANSGLVVSIEQTNFDPEETGDPLKALEFQQMVEQKAFLSGGGGQTAPAQRLADFVAGKHSTNLPACSYQPGLNSVNLHEVLPAFVSESLQGALEAFGQKMRGYFTNEAVLVATESRTSSPVRIPRDKLSLQHPQVSGLYPCGEGAGYAGGIVSAAMDGQRCAAAIWAVATQP